MSLVPLVEGMMGGMNDARTVILGRTSTNQVPPGYNSTKVDVGTANHIFRTTSRPVSTVPLCWIESSRHEQISPSRIDSLLATDSNLMLRQ